MKNSFEKEANNMGKSKDGYFFIEYLVIAAVIFTATSLYFEDSTQDSKQLELVSLTGTIELSTRDSMDTFGLQNFKTGAIADINLSVNSILVPECATCTTTTSGNMLYGEIIITELFDFENRLGRVEGNLNFTHLLTFSTSQYVISEQVLFHWSAGDIDSSWKLTLNHNPPRWLPKYDINTLFIETELGLESRAGPELLIKNPSINQRIIHACLPDSFLCKSSSPDALLIANYGSGQEETIISDSIEWHLHNISEYPHTNITDSIADGILPLDNTIPNQYGFTPWPEPELANVSTYLIEDEDTRILPLSIWFNSIDLTPIQIDLFGQSVVFMQNESQSVYNILASDGSMKVGLVIY